jgi:hypothetical protein
MYRCGLGEYAREPDGDAHPAVMSNYMDMSDGERAGQAEAPRMGDAGPGIPAT